MRERLTAHVQIWRYLPRAVEGADEKMFTQSREVGYLYIVYMCLMHAIGWVLTFDQPCTVSLVDLVIVAACCSLLRELSEPAVGGCEGTSEGGVLLAEGGPPRLTQLFPAQERMIHWGPPPRAVKEVAYLEAHTFGSCGGRFVGGYGDGVLRTRRGASRPTR